MRVRELGRRPIRRVLVHGLAYFGQMFAKSMSGNGWEFRYYPDSGIGNLTAMARELYACDVAYQIGGRVTFGKFLRVANILRKKKIVMHWVGSDVLDERETVVAGESEPWITQCLHHWAVSDWLKREVEALKISCERVPLSSSHIPEKPTPLPSKFGVLVYVPTTRRSSLYGLDRILQVARELSHISFDLVGLSEGLVPDPPSNLRVHGRVQNLLDFYKQATVLWRPVRHDGLSCMVLEALGHGRHVLWTYPFPGCVQVRTASEASDQIIRLHALHECGQLQINCVGVRAIAEGGYLPQQLRINIRDRLERILES
ncbi:MAG TPA: hypothetical protein VEJ46_18210 [Candidatus Acidoferrum sp.]|nr:hypothetical protein [Candidatus Acidoferrum sp.]